MQSDKETEKILQFALDINGSTQMIGRKSDDSRRPLTAGKVNRTGRSLSAMENSFARYQHKAEYISYIAELYGLLQNKEVDYAF